jgi:septal ring factor EnvC (AmiA/AmiB activator)
MNPRLRNKMKSKLADDDSLTSMFTDIVQTFEQQRQDKYQVEDQMLQMAIAFEKTRVAFVELAADSDHYAQENKSLSNQLKTIQTKYRVARDSLYDEQKTREKLQKDLVELESTLALMSEIVFDNKGMQAFNQFEQKVTPNFHKNL